MSLDPKEDGNDESPPSGNTAVWILDDSPMEAAMARRALAPHYDVRTFVDGSTLLEAIATETPPNVLLLDWQLPGMSGIEVCRFLRTSRDEMELPVLMLTVYGHKADLVDGLGAGANDYLTKPYDAPELAARVATLARLNSLHHKVRRGERVAADLLARERRAREESDAANRTKDEFLALVSHELRTPLNAILGWTRLLRAGDLSTDQTQRALATVERNALSQTRLIDDLMDTSRILSGKLTIAPQTIELVGLIQTSVEAVRPSAVAKNIAIHVAIDPEAGEIAGDAARIEQMLGNLLTNAIKFTPSRGTVEIRLARAGAYVEVAIVDSGAGISADFLPHVFERFRQADNSVSSTKGGLGLGLAIVRHIVELHGGVVEARSEGPGRGATFTVRLPRLGADLAHDLGSRPSIVPANIDPSKALEGVRVLIVDDDEDALFPLSVLLSRNGAEVDSATSVAMALSAIEKQRPNVIVSDIGMPVQDGYDLMRTVRKRYGAGPDHIPAIALTAFGSPEHRQLALEAGFDVHASKPLGPDDLLRQLTRLLGRPNR